MAGIAIITVEGVLAREADNFAAGIPIPAGITLYHALKETYRLALCTYSNATGDQMTHWVQTNGLRGHSYLLTPSYEQIGIHKDKALEQYISVLRGGGSTVEMVIDASPDMVARAMNMGLVGMLVGHPAYARPEFRPDAPRTIRQWGQIEQAVELSTKARAEWEENERTVIGGL
jgi:hypothetical protein